MTVATSESMWWTRERAAASSSSAGWRDKAEGPIPFASVIVFTCILLLSPQYWFPALKPLRIAFLAAGLAAASLLWERWRDRKALGLTREILICFALLA